MASEDCDPVKPTETQCDPGCTDTTATHALKGGVAVAVPERESSGLKTSRSVPVDACASCGQRRSIMIGMAPGRDGVPWCLCSRCWTEGAPSARSARPELSRPEPHPTLVLPVFSRQRTAHVVPRFDIDTLTVKERIDMRKTLDITNPHLPQMLALFGLTLDDVHAYGPQHRAQQRATKSAVPSHLAKVFQTRHAGEVPQRECEAHALPERY